MSVIPDLAVEIDRTVLAVGTRGGTRHRDTYVALTEDITDVARRVLPRIAYFLLDGPVPRQFVSERIPYTPYDEIHGALDDLVSSGHLVAVGDTDVAPGEAILPALRTVVDGRVEMAQELWSGVPDVADEVAEIAGQIRSAVPEEALLAHRHAAIDEPKDFWHRIYERLTTVRYVRADAHRLAWRSFGCDGPLMVQLTTAWNGEVPAKVDLLEAGGWWDGALTAEARDVRDRVEARTNELNAEFLSGVDPSVPEALRDALGGLPGTPIARPV